MPEDGPSRRSSAAQQYHHPHKENNQSPQAHIGAGDAVPEGRGAHFSDEVQQELESKGIDKPHPAGKRSSSFCDAQDQCDHIRKIKSHKDDETGNQIAALFRQNNR